MERNTKETLRRANFPFEKLDMISIPRDSTDSAESDGGGKENKKKTVELGAEQSLDFKTIQGFIRGLELFSLLTLVC